MKKIRKDCLNLNIFYISEILTCHYYMQKILKCILSLL